MAEKKEISTTEKPFKDPFKRRIDGFHDAIACMIGHYTSEQMSQAERLIGFAVVLFAVLGTIGGQLSKFFPDLVSLLPKLDVYVLETVKFLILFCGTSILLVFIFRAAFRFVLFNFFSTAARDVTETDVLDIYKKRIENESMTLHQAIHYAASEKLEVRRWGRVPIVWFMGQRERDFRLGWILCTFLGTVFSLFIVFLLS